MTEAAARPTFTEIADSEPRMNLKALKSRTAVTPLHLPVLANTQADSSCFTYLNPLFAEILFLLRINLSVVSR
jgi:hypothetical protein